MPEDRFDDLFGLYIDLRLGRAMKRKIESLENRRHFESREDDEILYEEEIDEVPPAVEIPTPRQLAPPPPHAPPSEAPQQQHPRNSGQQNGYTPSRPKRGRPPGPRPQLPGGSSGQNNNQEGF